MKTYRTNQNVPTGFHVKKEIGFYNDYDDSKVNLNNNNVSNPDEHLTSEVANPSPMKQQNIPIPSKPNVITVRKVTAVLQKPKYLSNYVV